MVDFVKRKIVEKLAKFTKHLNPNDISLSFLKGKGELNNLDLNADVITDILRLPPWIRIKSVFCDQIKIDVPFTDLHKSPIKCFVHTVIIEVSTCDEDEDRERSEFNLKKLSSSSPSSYGLTEKIVDGIKVEIGLVQVRFANPVFKANLEMTDVVIESTTPQWKPDILPHCRYMNEDEGSIIIYKRCIWSSLKLEGEGIDDRGNSKLVNPLRLMAATTEIHVTLKRRLNDCKVLYTRIAIDLGDLSWILTQEHLKSVSLLVQSLTEAAVKWNKQERQKMTLLRGSHDSLDSTGSIGSVASSTTREDDTHSRKKTTPKKGSSKDLRRETSVRNREIRYQLGQDSLPAYEVIQDSIHIKANSVNLQLCDKNGSLLMQVNDLIVDIYLDQLATTGRCHWNKSNMKLEEATDWSSKLVKTAEKIQYVDLPSINLFKLRERGIVVRCSDFSIKSEDSRLLPIISCDNKTFSLPNDNDNPAFQFVISLYYYPLEEGHKFLVPRPNIYAYLSPVHVNVHQQLFLWLAEFVHGVVRTVNISLVLSAHTEGKMFMEEIKAKREMVQQLPGFDVRFYIPYTKITLPLDHTYTDNRPQGIQVETGGIHIENQSLYSILSDATFLSAWEKCKAGWLSSSAELFPNSAKDPPSTPSILIDLFEKEIKAVTQQKSTGETSQQTTSMSNRAHSVTRLEVPQRSHGRGNPGRHSAPDISHHKISLHQLNLLAIETWYCYTKCISLSFVSDLTHKATLYGKEFVPDFPIQAWIFQPKKIGEIINFSSSPSARVGSSLPEMHLMLDVPQEVQVKIERLHFLFLMRLKDSFQGFKNKLMSYLTLESLLQTQETEAFHGNKDTNDSAVSSECNSEDDLKDKLSAAFKNKAEQRTSRSDDEPIKSLVTGSVSVEGIRVTVALPSLGPVLKSPKPNSPMLKKMAATNNTESSQKSSQQSTTSPPPPSLPAVKEPVQNSTAHHSSEVSNRKAQSMPQLNVTNVDSVNMNSTTSGGSLSEISEDFVFVSNPSYPSSLSVSPIPEGSVEIGSEFTPVHVPEPSLPSIDGLSDTSVNIGVESMSQSEDETHTRNAPNGILPVMKNKEEESLEILKPGSPLLTPTHSLYVNTGKLKLLLSLSELGIALRTTVDSLHIEELTDAELSEIERKYNPKKIKRTQDVANPVIKARVQMGKGVNVYFPDNTAAADNDFPPIDGVVFLKVSGLKVILGMKNLMAVKDFFDDEKESSSPLPIQLRIIETQLIIKDDLSYPLDHPKNATVNVPDIFINRGPLAHGTNLIQTDTPTESTTNEETDSQPLVETIVTDIVTDSNTNLIDSFHQFIDAFQAHTAQKGQVTISQPEKVSQLLDELGKTLLSPPPSYNESLSCDFYSNVTSATPHQTLDSLMAEVDALKADNKRLQLELVSTKEEQSEVIKEREEVTRELIDVKMKLASTHLVLEQHLNSMERMYSENCNLKDRLGE